MSAEAIGRVPLSDWLMAVAVLACGVAAIAATWRYTRFLTLVDDTGDGGLTDKQSPLLALPPGPPNHAPALDDVDRALWELIEGEYARLPQGQRSPREEVLRPAARRLAA